MKNRGRQVFAVIFNQRRDPRYGKLRDMVRGGKPGQIRRSNWIITDWFRPEACYRRAGWCATRAGEGAACCSTFEHADGTTAVFIASNGEAPGTNRLGVMGDRGRLVLEGGRPEFLRNDVAAEVFSRGSKAKFKAPPVQRLEVPLPPGTGEQHVGILENFVRAIRRGEKLAAAASEGLHSVGLAKLDSRYTV